MADIKSLLLEDAFTFQVGPMKTVVKIPPSLLSSYSAPLKAMVSNGMRETKKKIAMLPEEEPETLGYFLEWAFTSIYRVKEVENDCDNENQKPGNLSHYKCTNCSTFAAAPTHINVLSSCSTCKTVAAARCPRCNRPNIVKSSYRTDCTNDNCAVRVLAVAGTESDHVKVRDRFKSLSTAVETAVGPHNHGTIRMFMGNSLIKVPVTGNFVAHAKVHVFAEKYLIKELGQMARHLLHRDIMNCDVDKVGSGNLVDMLEYVYQNTSGNNGTNDVSNLKHLALKYVVFNSDKLLQCKRFCNLLRKGGEFGIDFTKMLSKHVF